MTDKSTGLLRFTRLALISTIALGCEVAQQTTPPPNGISKRFEVASAKLEDSERSRQQISVAHGRVTMTGVTLIYCVSWAYGVEPFQITGPDWARAKHYSILAQTDSSASEDQVKVLLRTLLDDRFSLVLRREINFLAMRRGAV